MLTDPTQPMPPSPYGPTTILPKVGADDPTVPAPKPPQGCFTFRRIAYGCGFGCLGLACLIGGGLLAIYHWATSPSTPIAGEVLIDRQTVTASVLQIDPNDPGVADLIRALATEIDTNRPTAIPAEVRKLMGAFGAKDTPAILTACLPAMAAQTFRRPPDGGAEHELTAISISKFANLLGAIVDRQDAPAGGSIQTHGGHKILVGAAEEAGATKPGKARALAGNTGLAASDPDTIMHALDLVDAGARDLGGDSLLLDLHDRVEKGALAWGLAVNRDGALVDHFPFLRDLRGDRRFLDLTRGAAWDAKLVSADKARGHVHFKMKDYEDASALARYLADAAEDVHRSASADHDIDLRYKTEADKAWCVVSFEVEKIEKSLVRKLVGGE